MFGLFIKLMNSLKFFEFFVSKTIAHIPDPLFCRVRLLTNTFFFSNLSRRQDRISLVNKRTYDKWLAFEPLVIVLFTLSLSGTKYIYYI